MKLTPPSVQMSNGDYTSFYTYGPSERARNVRREMVGQMISRILDFRGRRLGLRHRQG